MDKITPFWRDWLERVLWTAAQVVLALIIVEVNNLEGTYVAVVAAGLAALKGLIARKVGNPDTASTLNK